MLLSELIKNCNDLLNEHGDGEVFWPFEGTLYEPVISEVPSIVSEWVDEDTEFFFEIDENWKYLMYTVRHRQ